MLAWLKRLEFLLQTF